MKLIAKWITDFDCSIKVPRDFDDVEDGEYPSSSLIPLYYEMTIHHKYYLTKNINASRYLTEDHKQNILASIFGADISDSTIRFREIARMRTPTKEVKEELWTKLTDLNSTSSY